MFFPLERHEWWLCHKPDCTEPDRASALESQFWIRWRLQDSRTDTGKMRLLQDLAQQNISHIPPHIPQDVFSRKVEQLFMFGQLHLHKKHLQPGPGTGNDNPDPPFPLANRQPRVASQPPPMVDQPIFARNLNMAAQAAALIAAASSGAPFCEE